MLINLFIFEYYQGREILLRGGGGWCEAKLGVIGYGKQPEKMQASGSSKMVNMTRSGMVFVTARLPARLSCLLGYCIYFRG